MVKILGGAKFSLTNWLRYESFGDKHPGASFYVVWQSRAGLFAQALNVVYHCMIAERKGMIPVVDGRHVGNVHKESEPVDGSVNPWEYYFLPVSSFDLNEVYQSENVYFCNDASRYRKIAAYDSDCVKRECALFGRYIRFGDVRVI